jgi:hypothetical protein
MSINMHGNVANSDTSRKQSDGWSAAVHLTSQLPVADATPAAEAVPVFSASVLFFGDAPMAALRARLARALKN